MLVDLEEGNARQEISPDVFSINLTYDVKRLAPTIDEIKVSRSDFLGDVKNPSKRLGYTLIAEVVNYVVPAGMITLDEVPPECGLIEETSPGTFVVVSTPKKRKVELKAHTYLNLVLKHGLIPDKMLI